MLFLKHSSLFQQVHKCTKKSFLRLNHSNKKIADVQVEIKCEEIKIPVPWGHLAAKWWGPHDTQPIVTLHGWQDNCNSFDFLIPMLPRDASFLAIDFPGHGHSTYLPPGMFYQVMDIAILLRRMQNHFNWKRLRIMGHSLGARAAYKFGGLFPQSTEFIICIDALVTFLNPKKFDRVTQSIDDYLKFEKQIDDTKGRRSYSLKDMAKMLHYGSRESVDLDKCEYLLGRNIEKCRMYPGNFCFTRDPRTKSGLLMNWPMEDVIEHAKRTNFPILLLLSKMPPPSFSHADLQTVMGVLREHNDKFESHLVDGTHHGHFNDPKIHAQHIERFINKYNFK